MKKIKSSRRIFDTSSSSELKEMKNKNENRINNSLLILAARLSLTSILIITAQIAMAVPSLNVSSPVNQSHYNHKSVLMNASSSEEGTGNMVSDIDRTLLLWMRMDDRNATNVFDNSSYSHTGTFNGTVNPGYNASGRYGGSYNFSDGFIGMIVNQDMLTTSNRITVGAWVYMTAASSYGTVIFSGKGTSAWPWVFEFVTTTRKICFYMTGINPDWNNPANTAVTLNSWAHLAVTYNGTDIQYYFNGTPDGGTPGTGAISQPIVGTTFQIGERWDGYPFVGLIDEVVMYNRSLSADEIKDLYNATKGQFDIMLSNNTLSDGNHTLNIHTQDLSGNVVSSGLIEFYVDTIPPNVNFTGNTSENGITLNVSSVFVNVSSDDTGKEHSAFVDLNQSLVLWMRMDDRSNATYIYDNSTYGNNGTVYGDTSYTPAGKRGEAAKFDGKTGYITAGNDSSLNLTSGFTLSVWAMRIGNSSTDQSILIGKGNGYGTDAGYSIAWNNTNNIHFYIRNSANDGYTYTGGWGTVTDNAWHHLLAVHNGDTALIYMDGILKSSNSASSAYASPMNLSIGRGDPNEYFNGSIDDATIFSRALSASEISALYDAGLSQYYTTFTPLADGNYTYTAYAQDLAGNVNATEMRSANVSAACRCHNDRDWIVRSNCYLTDSTCNIPDYKVICLSTGSIIMSNYTIIAKKAITPINHGCLLMDNKSRLFIKY